ncbi:MAG: ImmA/IrrE family metallo-endopeptidase [Candidatus Hydrogenedentes bacterium]|nr:ImmA/IrrE family metallo-endopeptidase [Candidatus Hydrogenedentota bacterium]
MGGRTRYSYEPDYAVPPGKTLLETIESLGMTQRELGARTGLTPVSVARIIGGDQPITYETANKLELATGVPARFWNNLEAQFQERKAKIDEREQMRADLDWLRCIPVNELQSRGIVGDHKDKVLVLRDVLAFYGVSSVEAWHEIWETPEVAARRSKCFETAPGPTSAWIRQGELKAHSTACADFNKPRFVAALKTIRSLTKEQPSVFEPEMKKLCAASGVAVALVREMKKVPWSGATRWLSPDKAMILLSLRGKGEDKFWFSFFHEAGHVLLHSKKDLYIDDGEAEDEREKEANAFAAELLVPHTFNSEIRACKSKAAVEAIAHKLDVSPGIVAGRYQFLTKKWTHFNELIRRWNWRPTESSRKGLPHYA